MNNCSCYGLDVLPEIEMYGGDTSDWEISLFKNGNEPITYQFAKECTVILTLVPLTVTSGLGNNATPVAPLLTKSATITEAQDGSPNVVFSFSATDTKNLRGKFIYQIEVQQSTNLRLCQGRIYIKQNINR